MRYDQLFTKLFCRPILIEAGARIGFERTLLALLSGKPIGEAASALSFEMRKLDPERSQRRSDNITEIFGDTAVIHIDGPIDKHLAGWELSFGACDLNDVDKALDDAGSNNAIKNVLLRINSPGGSLTGVPETADKVAALATRKNVFAFTDSMCCSAAYWIACQADQIFATASAQVGSIGVYLALLDETRALEDEGLKIELIKDGKLKAAGASFKPLSDDERAHFQDQVNQIGKMFRAAVTSKRLDVSEDTMQGQSFLGAETSARGLVDGILPDMNAVLAEF